MRKAALLYNPQSGGRQERRWADVEAVLKVLRTAGIEATANETGSPANAAEQARRSAASGCDTVFACGGDGTIHDVLQGLAGSQTALAVIPLGTGNVLAHDLGIPLDPVGAARVALSSPERLRIALGRVEYQDFAGARCSRYFTVAVGVGVDAHLFYTLDGGIKKRLGIAAYYVQAAWLWLTHRMQFFEVEASASPGETPAKISVTELIAVRTTHFGGLLRELAPGASLSRQDLQLVLFRTRSRLCYLAFVIRCILGQRWNVPGIELHSATLARCRSISPDQSPAQNIYVEADGELVGMLPAEISIVPDALTVLVPRERTRSIGT
jgi:diacylglycerol kinase (ATP)